MNNPPEEFPQQQSPPTSQRHGCLTAWLVVALIANTLCLWYACDTITKIIVYFSRKTVNSALVPALTHDRNILIMTAICNVGNILAVIALFRWRKWGAYALYAIPVINLGFRMMAGERNRIFVILPIHMLLVYIVLNVGGEKKAWPRLK